MSVNAYELIPSLKNVRLFDDNRTKITCLDASGVDLYVGTNTGYLFHYKYEELEDDEGRAFFYDKVNSKVINERHPVQNLQTAGFLNIVVALTDGSLQFFNISTFESTLLSAKLKGITAFYIQEGRTKEQTCVTQLCVGNRQKLVQIFSVEPEKLLPLKNITLSDIPRRLSFNSGVVCVAFQNRYSLVNMNLDTVTDLFDLEPGVVNPLVAHVGKGEFLMNGPSALGIFASVDGASQRPPLQWSPNVLDVVFQQPYILALSDEFITVHSLSDQEQKQSVLLTDGVCLSRTSGTNVAVFAARGQEVLALIRQPWEKQALELLTEGRVEEALRLAHLERAVTANKDTYLKKLRRILVRAGFVRFQQGDLKEAQDYFEQGFIDIRELLSLYTSLLPKGYNFTPSISAGLPTVEELCAGDENKLCAYRGFLLAFLEEHRESKLAQPHKQLVETALLKLYAELKPDDLDLFIVTMDGVDVEDVITFLHKQSCYHASCLLYRWQGNMKQAMALWKRLLEGELTDDTFPGIEFIIEILTNLEEHDIVFQYADWLLDKSEERAVTIFINRPADEVPSDRLKVEYIVDYLQRYPRAAIIFLEHQIYQKQDKTVRFHTYLAKLYMDSVISLQSESASEAQLKNIRARFQRFLEDSELYRVEQILSQVKQAGGLIMETAILNGKLGNHDEALRIIVQEESDYQGAERYCFQFGRGKETDERQQLFECLVRVYLDPQHPNRHIYSAAAIELLKNEKAEFDYIRLLTLLPDAWSLSLVVNFIARALRTTLHKSRMAQLERGLVSVTRLTSARDRIACSGSRVLLCEDTLCARCKHPLLHSAGGFARLSSGVLVHPSCVPIEAKLH